jgi:hypothetical protein
MTDQADGHLFQDSLKLAGDAVARLQRAGREYGSAIRLCHNLAAEKAEREQRAIVRIMGDPEAPNINSLTKRPHSASSAEDIKETDRDYRKYLDAVATAEQNRVESRTEVTVATVAAAIALEVLTWTREQLRSGPAGVPTGYLAESMREMVRAHTEEVASDNPSPR